MKSNVFVKLLELKLIFFKIVIHCRSKIISFFLCDSVKECTTVQLFSFFILVAQITSEGRIIKHAKAVRTRTGRGIEESNELKPFLIIL